MSESTIHLRLERDASAPGRARHEVRAWLAHFECSPEVVDMVEVVISELVTNAVVHAVSAPELMATYRNGKLLVEVHDHEPTLSVAPRGADGDSAGGYGLRLVAELTQRWGWQPTNNGKRMWAETLC